MRIDRGKVLFAVVAVLLAVLFVRLGLWQVERHRERKAANEERRARMAMETLAVESAADLAALPAGEEVAWRLVRLRGRWDHQNEILLRPRSHEGRPAIELLTPLRLTEDTAILVLRGWLPSPDALHAPIRAARGPGDWATVRGLAVVPGAPVESGAGSRPARVVVDGEDHLALRRLDLEIVSEHLPYSLGWFYIRRLAEESTEGRLRALPELELAAGPHLSYAIQWFAFAVIALIGTGILLARSR